MHTSTPGLIRLNFVTVNDSHGIVEPIRDSTVSDTTRVGGLARMKTVIEREKAGNPDGTLVLHAGDHAEGSMVAYLSKGKVVAEATANWFDAVIPGNHCHAWGIPAMLAMFDGLSSVALCANVGPLPNFKPYHIFECKGVKVGVVGINTPELSHYIAQSKLDGLTIEQPVPVLQRLLPEMKKKGADIIVALSHVGFEQPDPEEASDITIAREMAALHDQDPHFPKLDLIVGAHTHHRLSEGHREGHSLIVQAGALTEFVGSAELVYDPAKGQVVSHSAHLIPVLENAVEPDPTVETIIEPYLAQAKEIGTRKMGEALEPLHHRHREAAKLNQIMADAILEKTDAELVLCNSRSLRADIGRGVTTYADLYSSLPFTEDAAVTLSATGAMIRKEIETCLKDGARELAVPAGLRYSYDPSRPEGQRVTELETTGGEPIENGRWYRVGMNWTMSNTDSWRGCRDYRDTGNSCQELYMQRYTEGSPWRNDADDRVKRKTPEA